MTEEKSIFSKIVDREVPAQIIYETDDVLAFRDVNPQAPVHILVIPKKQVRDVMEADESLLGKVMEAVRAVAAQEGLVDDGFRVVLNTGTYGGQTVFHLHAHVLGGRVMQWPPG